ncbi:hypothetical protein EUGRSUZ_I01745 [Eucalyptus grandis]|uniref:Uncharacterized protein n=2 Tax=Eucalyptus grandis TaxID=71139 RepID=A0ACC3JFX0_EUCGR|nr:hypothetical protein EUGRSUZ_I01745 [Eucalyptus grandis]
MRGRWNLRRHLRAFIVFSIRVLSRTCSDGFFCEVCEVCGIAGLCLDFFIFVHFCSLFLLFTTAVVFSSACWSCFQNDFWFKSRLKHVISGTFRTVDIT